ncbi:hypothetical protein IT882_13200 [Microbacterium schleiferi]|uniref:DNA-binding protein n=1 Tax=Microbacterium schleiferi TaxID=69362 RepID=A0A7S8MWE2_9MICO|nr:hypothetical protein [Microbacterium schleiferi]QPE04148.1 hypothetical protein IT882_13200 [Microbacterium schleiferi]
MGDEDFLDLAAIAELLGVQVNSAQVYHKRAVRARREGTAKPWDMPEPDNVFGRSPVWREAKIRQWIESRPGRSTEAATEARRQGRAE